MSAGVDPAIRLKVMTRLGLDQPLHVQYTRWLNSAARGDFGFAYGYGEPVLSLIGPHVSATYLLNILGHRSDLRGFCPKFRRDVANREPQKPCDAAN